MTIGDAVGAVCHTISAVSLLVFGELVGDVVLLVIVVDGKTKSLG